MSNIVAKIGIFGDLHLHSKNYGFHLNYPKESLGCLDKITALVKSEGLTHLIGLGDFSFGRFTSLEYRLEVEKRLEEQHRLVNGQYYELQGNHDTASYGMTEYAYYIQKGLLKPAQHLVIGDILNLSMLNYGEVGKKPIIPINPDMWNVLLLHDYVKFSNTAIGDYGDAIILDEIYPFHGLNLIIAGHIHHFEAFFGNILNQSGVPLETGVLYPGCITRPAYEFGKTETVGHMAVITVTDDKQVEYVDKSFELDSLSSCFNIEAKEVERSDKIAKATRLDISDIVAGLDNSDKSVGSPEEIIEALQNVPEKYKAKAISLLKAALA